MKLYCYHTPSHDIFFENWFRPTLLDNYEIVRVGDTEQLCSSAKFREKGWRETQIRKVELWLKASKENDVFIGSDVDVQWFKPTLNDLIAHLGDNDFAVQSYGGKAYCSGFFICRGNQRTIEMWTHILDGLKNNKAGGEQDLLIPYLNASKLTKWVPLPRNLFWTPCRLYKDLAELRIPDTILMHHATYVVGIQNKIIQLEYVRTAD